MGASNKGGVGKSNFLALNVIISIKTSTVTLYCRNIVNLPAEQMDSVLTRENSLDREDLGGQLPVQPFSTDTHNHTHDTYL